MCCNRVEQAIVYTQTATVCSRMLVLLFSFWISKWTFRWMRKGCCWIVAKYINCVIFSRVSVCSNKSISENSEVSEHKKKKRKGKTQFSHTFCGKVKIWTDFRHFVPSYGILCMYLLSARFVIVFKLYFFDWLNVLCLHWG